jgi:O-antigen/teichoic acid export membrane protein
VARNFLALGGGEVAARVISFGATVYLARTLGASGYGIIAVAMAVMLYLTYLTDCGVEVLGVRRGRGCADADRETGPSGLIAPPRCRCDHRPDCHSSRPYRTSPA